MPHKQSIEDVQRQLDTAVARINEDLDLNEEAKERMIKEVYQEARSKVVQDAEEGREELEADLRVARRIAFAPPVIEVTEGRRPDPAYIARWYADEIDKVRELREPTELEHLFQQALLTNNLPRCKAVLVRAYELGNSRLVGMYFENFPEEKDVWDDFSDAAEAFNEFERATHLFSAPHRLKPLEAYLA